MHAIWRNRTCWFFSVFLSISATAVCAEELLVMPFRCSINAGRPVLTPSEDEGYRILGQREQRTFKACSPVNPDTCKQWTVHRFDLECDGVRVPWASVAAAADGPRHGRAWVEDGRVRVRMPPWWSMAPGDPCARAVPYEDRWQGGQFARYCAERRGFMPPAVVDMPAGFSPMLGTGGFFVAASGAHGATAPPAAAGSPSPAGVPSRPTGPREVQKEVAKRPTGGPPEQTAKAPPPVLAALPAPPAPAGTPEQLPEHTAKAPPPAQAAAPPPPARVGTPEHPTLINRPDQPQAPLPQEPPPTAQSPAKFGTPALKEAAVQTPEVPALGESGASQSIEVNIIGLVRSPTAMLAGLAAIAAFTAGTFLWLRRHERTHWAGAASREFASVSLTGAQNALTISPRVPAGVGSGSAPVQQKSTSLSVPTWVPRNRTEALSILGMGVSADATQAAIKRIVDGLRLSWHPDHAKDDGDRQLREHRLKQINAAWEILNGSRQEA